MAPFIPNVPIPTPLSSPPQPKRLSGICQVVWFHDGAFVIKGLLEGQKYLTISLEVLANFSKLHPPPTPPSMAFYLRPLSTISSSVAVLDHAF